MNRLALTAGLLSLSVIAAAPQTPPVRITKGAVYGWEDIPATASLSGSERAAGAGVLGRVTSVAEGRDGRVYVLDGVGKKVVVFGADGKYQKLFGQTGAGPGEFQQPTRISVTKDGSIAVYDRKLARLSMFDAEGKSLRDLRLGEGMVVNDLVVSDTAVWVSLLVMKAGSPMLRAYHLDTGKALDSLASLGTQEIEVSSGGNPGRVVGDGAGGVLFVGPLPVQWRVHSKGQTTERGASIFPDAGLLTFERDGHETRAATVGVRGAARMSNGTLVVSFTHMDKKPTKTTNGEESQWLGLWSPSGRELGRVNVTEDGYRVMASARNGDVFLVGETEYPQVIRAKLTLQ